MPFLRNSLTTPAKEKCWPWEASYLCISILEEEKKECFLPIKLACSELMILTLKEKRENLKMSERGDKHPVIFLLCVPPPLILYDTGLQNLPLNIDDLINVLEILEQKFQQN